MTFLELEHLEAGWCLSVGALAQQGGPWRRQKFPASVTLITHPTHGTILFDAGYSRAAVAALRRWPAWPYGKLLPVRLPPGEAVVEQLAARGDSPETVTAILCSHLHMDHLAGAVDFPHAPVWLDPAEISTIHRHKGLAAVRHGVVPAIVPGRSRLRPFNYVPAPPELAPFGHAMDFFGDGSLWVVPSPGHTAGSVAAVARIGDGPDGGGLVLLAGDIAWSVRALREGIEAHWLTRRIVAHDVAAARQAVRGWQAWLTRNPAARVVVSHEAS